MGRIICCAFAYLNEYKYLNTVAYIIMMYISNSKQRSFHDKYIDINFSNVIVIYKYLHILNFVDYATISK